MDLLESDRDASSTEEEAPVAALAGGRERAMDTHGPSAEVNALRGQCIGDDVRVVGIKDTRIVALQSGGT